MIYRSKILFILLLSIAFSYCRLPSHVSSPLVSAGDKISGLDSIVTSVPGYLKYDTFYKKYINANGMPIVSSGKVPDRALFEARNIINTMLRKIPDVKNELIKNKVRVAVMALSELPTNIPEHRDLNSAFPETNWDIRGRGYGATIERPATSCAEENLLCYSNDLYYGENILVHEFAHSIHKLGLRYTDTSFERKLTDAYQHAKQTGLWRRTYAISNKEEYWAEGVQDWFNVNLYAIPSNGIHNEIYTRAQLGMYDPELFKLISLYFYEDNGVGCQTNK